MNIDYVAVGHFTHDVTPHGPIIGGAASYSSITVQNLGLHPHVVTAFGADFRQDNPLLKGIKISHQISGATTTFHNIYTPSGRRQRLLGRADTIYAEHIPAEWRNANIAYLCPVADEVDASVVHCFPNALIGATPQGWMRRWDKEHNVYPKKWASADAILPHVDVLILSNEDIATFPEELERFISLTKNVILTKGKRGATLYQAGQIIESAAYPANELDPTGAGDVFAAAFLVQYSQTKDITESLNFAHCVASFAVEAEGTTGIPTREQVMRRFRQR
ncbi:MAG: ribokinase [Deltaproteobacteria bacterium]|nr:ribokinase [Deltaproteobacteria bacterium]